MPRVVTIHQPEHLPWLGFFAKAARADLLVSLDAVPFRKNYFQNRNRILGAEGRAQWLTVPVRRGSHLEGRISDVEIADAPRWRTRYLRALEQRYGKHAGFEAHFGAIEEAVARPWRRLVDLNHALLDALWAPLGLTTPVVVASALGGEGTRSALLADLCRRVGAEVYLSGPSGRDYLDLAPFRKAGVEVRFHDYDHPAYEQRGAPAFVSHLSAVDLLFNYGPAAAEVLRRGSRISDAARELPAPGPMEGDRTPAPTPDPEE